MIITVLNWIMVVLSTIAAVLAWRIYSITRAKSLLYIFVAMCLGIVTRALIALNGHNTLTTLLATVFWALWAFSLYLLLQLLTKYMKVGGIHDEEIRAEGEATGKAAGLIEGKEIGKAVQKAEARKEEIQDLHNSMKESKKEDKKNG